MENYKINKELKWDYENGFYLTCGKERIGKFINQLEIYKRTLKTAGDIIEFGVYKGSSLMRLFYLRELLENNSSRKIIGFDIFGEFPKQVKLENDKKFIKQFEKSGGYGISYDELNQIIIDNKFENFELIKGNIIKTLPRWLKNNEERRFSLVHIDVDVYEPTKLILNLIWDRIVEGGILMLDDYGTVAGETKAVDEFLDQRKLNNKILKEKYYKVPTYIVKSI